MLVDVDADAVRAAYEQLVPHIESDLGDGPTETGSLLDGWPKPEMEATPLLRDVESRTYEWRRSMSREEYLGLLDTQSAYRILPDEVRERFFDALGAALPEQVTHDVVTILHLARSSRARRRPDVTTLELVGGVEKRELVIADPDPGWAQQ